MRTSSLLACLLFTLVQLGASAQELRVGVLVGPNQAGKMRATLDRFNKESGIKIVAMVRSDTEYKAALPGWLLDGKDTPDVLFWQSSQRLFVYAERKALAPITTLWNQEKWDQDFAHVKSAVTLNGEVYGLPVSYYHWGLYYRRSLIDKYGGVPTTWSAFLELAARLKKDGITPFGLGNKEQWPVAAWFDYLDLRINGLAFHRQLLGGKIPFTDARVVAVFTELKKLLDLQYINPDAATLDRGDLLPLLYRNRLGFILSSNGITARIPESMLPEIGFAPFPQIVPGNDYEEAPMDILILPRNGANRAEAETFLKFMARPDIQSDHNAQLGFLPPNIHSDVWKGPFTHEGANLLKRSKGVSQFLDRDTLPQFEKEAIPLLGEFLATGNIADITARLEQARKAAFLR